jgi:hypothetical protein
MLLGKVTLLLTGLGIIAGLAGCSSSGSAGSQPPTQTSPQPTSVLFVSPPPASLAVKASATIFAAAIFPTTVPTGSSNSQVSYSITCGTSGACGTLSASDEGGAIVYTAPEAIPTGNTVTVTATSVVDTSKSISAAITIVPPIPISVAFFAPTPASLQVNAAFTLSAAITNDVSANPQVNWTVACGAADCGSFNPVTTTNEGRTTYTAPASIPPGGSVNVTVTSVTDPTKSASSSIIINAATPTLANGTYVFQLSGQVGPQASFYTGVFVANNGVITSGEQDTTYFVSDDNGPYAYATFQQISGGSYATTPTGNLQVSLQVGPNEVETLQGTLSSGSKGFVAGLDGSPANGTLDLQTSTAAPSGGYALSLSGGDLYAASAWIGGILNIDSAGRISGAGSVLDVLDNQPGYTGTHSLGASTVSAPDANGRILLQLLPDASSPIPPLYLAGYIIDATHIRLAETGDIIDNTNFRGVLGGTALGQGASTGHFSASSIAGSSYVFGAQGNDTHAALQLAGVFTPKADGTLTGTLNWNDLAGSSAQAPIPFTGTYTVDPTGRVTLSKLSDGSTFNYSLHLYLTGDGNGLLLSNDTADIFAGQAFQRQTAAFTPASFAGNYGFNTTAMPVSLNGIPTPPASTIGSFTAEAGNGTSTVAGFADTTGQAANFAISGSFTPSANGIFSGTLVGFNPASRTTAGNFTLYLVDGSQGVLIETDNMQLVLGRLARLQ